MSRTMIPWRRLRRLAVSRISSLLLARARLYRRADCLPPALRLRRRLRARRALASAETTGGGNFNWNNNNINIGRPGGGAGANWRPNVDHRRLLPAIAAT